MLRHNRLALKVWVHSHRFLQSIAIILEEKKLKKERIYLFIFIREYKKDDWRRKKKREKNEKKLIDLKENLRKKIKSIRLDILRCSK